MKNTTLTDWSELLLRPSPILSEHDPRRAPYLTEVSRDVMLSDGPLSKLFGEIRVAPLPQGVQAMMLQHEPNGDLQAVAVVDGKLITKKIDAQSWRRMVVAENW